MIKRAPLLLLFLGLTFAALNSEDKTEPQKESKKEPGTEKPELNPLEKTFVETLSGATLTGRWRLVEKGVLGTEREEKYTIRSVVKVNPEVWLINARIQYGGKDVTVPVAVKVLWAGDTPVITVNNAGIPGMGTYTARVMIYQGLYSGTWFGTGHGGFMSGVVTKEEGDGAGK